MNEHFLGQDRQFLNLPGFHTDASVSYLITVDENGYFSGTISIRDCSETVHLEFDVHSDDWLANSVHKMDTLINVLRSAKRDLRAAHKALKKVKKK